MWGLRIGLPLGSRAHGLVAAGDLAEAGRVLKRGYPRGMLQTRYGLHYLRARGHYHLAMGRHELALRDFLACGELTMRWEMDSAAFLPWRLDLAETLLCSGETARAREVAETQMEMAKGLSTAVYAASLRLWAATAPPEQRCEPLDRSVRLLESSVNRLEYARSLVALGQHHHETGDPEQAGHVLRKARVLANEIGAGPLATAIDTYARDARLPISAPRPPGREQRQEELKLSDAERRVAVLVLEGCTNRQISERLYITQSTVSQHLTRIYRKMKVNHRGDLVHELREALQDATGAR